MSILKEIPKIERPRERLELSGPESLSIAELIAILLRTGTKDLSSIDLAYKVLNEFETLDALSNATITELCKIKGIYKAKAITILASIELGKRISAKREDRNKVNDILDVYRLVKGNMERLDHEEIVLVLLSIKSEVIKVKKISIGTSSLSLLEGKDIFKWALKYSSNHFVVCHNHPSGDPSPSSNDKVLTDRLTEQANLMGINMVDHIIIGKGKFYSFRLKKILSC